GGTGQVAVASALVVLRLEDAFPVRKSNPAGSRTATAGTTGTSRRGCTFPGAGFPCRDCSVDGAARDGTGDPATGPGVCEVAEQASVAARMKSSSEARTGQPGSREVRRPPARTPSGAAQAARSGNPQGLSDRARAARVQSVLLILSNPVDGVFG